MSDPQTQLNAHSLNTSCSALKLRLQAAVGAAAFALQIALRGMFLDVYHSDRFPVKEFSTFSYFLHPELAHSDVAQLSRSCSSHQTERR